MSSFYSEVENSKTPNLSLYGNLYCLCTDAVCSAPSHQLYIEMYSYSSSRCHGPVRDFLWETKTFGCVYFQETQDRRKRKICEGKQEQSSVQKLASHSKWKNNALKALEMKIKIQLDKEPWKQTPERLTLVHQNHALQNTNSSFIYMGKKITNGVTTLQIQ